MMGRPFCDCCGAYRARTGMRTWTLLVPPWVKVILTVTRTVPALTPRMTTLFLDCVRTIRAVRPRLFTLQLTLLMLPRVGLALSVMFRFTRTLLGPVIRPAVFSHWAKRTVLPALIHRPFAPV